MKKHSFGCRFIVLFRAHTPHSPSAGRLPSAAAGPPCGRVWRVSTPVIPHYRDRAPASPTAADAQRLVAVPAPVALPRHVRLASSCSSCRRPAAAAAPGVAGKPPAVLPSLRKPDGCECAHQQPPTSTFHRARPTRTLQAPTPAPPLDCPKPACPQPDCPKPDCQDYASAPRARRCG